MFLILAKTLLQFFRWPKFDEGCWNSHMIPVHSKGSVYFAIRDKKDQTKKNAIRQKNGRLAIILPLI